MNWPSARSGAVESRAKVSRTEVGASPKVRLDSSYVLIGCVVAGRDIIVIYLMKG